MSRVLLLAATTGYQTRAFDEAAARLGVELVYATDRCGVLDDPWRDGAVPVRFSDESGSLAAVLEAARARPLDGVLAVGDRPTVLAAQVRVALGLKGHSVAASTAARSKQLTRERLRDAGLLVPWFVCASVSAASPVEIAARTLIPSITFPAVVKPVALSGSRGVMRVNDEEELVAALRRLSAIVQAADVRSDRNAAHDTILVEGFIPGEEYAIEGVMNDGRLHVLAIFNKPDPLNGPYFEETIYLTPVSAPADVRRAITDAVGRAVEALGLTDGPVHAECRVNAHGVYVVEVAARPIGGLCARALRFTSVQGPAVAPISLEELLLRHAIGESSIGWTREAAASGVMMVPIPKRGVLRSVSGVAAARAVAGVLDVRITAKADQLLVPLPEGASYLGFIFARGDAAGGVEQALRRAHACLQFAIDPEVAVLQSRHG